MQYLPDGIIIVVFFGGIIALVKSSLGMLLSEPIIICTAASSALGNFESGLMIGMLWQVIWMSDLPVGAVKLPDGSTGALISTVLYTNFAGMYPTLHDLILAGSIVTGGISAYLGGQFISDKRRVHSFYISITDDFADRGWMWGLDFVFLIGVIEQFISGAFISFFLYFIFGNLSRLFLPMIPDYWNSLFTFAPSMLWGISSALLLILSINRKTFPYAFLAFIISGWIFGIY